MGFIDKTKGFITKPAETFQAVRNDTLGDALKYTVIWYAIFCAIMGLMMAVMFKLMSSMFGFPEWVTDLGFLLIPIVVIVGAIVGPLGVLIMGAWQHLCVLICGGRNGYTETVKAVAYGATPNYLIGWIPIPYLASLVAFVGTLIVTIIGLRELQEISTGRAILAWVLAMVLPFILIIIIVAMAVGTSTTV